MADYTLPPQCQLLEQNSQLKALMTIIRSHDTSRADFIFYADRIIRLLVEEGKVGGKTIGTLSRMHAGLTSRALSPCRLEPLARGR